MKILDRYIAVSVAKAFLSGVTIFMVLLSAMELLNRLIELIAKNGIPVGTAIGIVCYKIPSLLVYAFPMAMLLGILLTFSRMSADSEMVAIRAAGMSFIRILGPTLLIALAVTGGTYWISNYFAPTASQTSVAMTAKAMKTFKSEKPINVEVGGADGNSYTIRSAHLDVKAGRMKQVAVTYYIKNIPTIMVYADRAKWIPEAGRWEFINAYPSDVAPNSRGLRMVPTAPGAALTLASSALQVTASPFDLQMMDDEPEPNNLTLQQITRYVADLKTLRAEMQVQGRWATRLAQRYSTPFTCFVFALIGAPLGLRHHRTSSAVGLGISLLVIFGYYFFSIYLSTFGDSGRLNPTVAAWTPNVIGAMLGMALIYRANQ